MRSTCARRSRSHVVRERDAQHVRIRLTKPGGGAGATLGRVSTASPSSLRRRRGARWRLVALAPGIVLSACGEGSSPDPVADRSAAVYTAILTWFAAAEADDPEPLPVFVEPRGDGASIPLGVQTDLIAAVADVADVRFIDVRDEALAEVDGHLVATDDGVLLRLPPVDQMADPVLADVDLHLRDERFLTLRFELEPDDEGWHLLGPPEQIATPEDQDVGSDDG